MGLPTAGRLEVRLGHDTYGAPLAADRQRWKLEDRLAVVITKLEERAVDDEAKRLAAKHKAAVRQREWERVKVRAVKRYEEQHRIEWLEEQLDRWHRATAIQSYVSNLRAGRQLSDDEAVWLDWVET